MTCFYKSHILLISLTWHTENCLLETQVLELASVCFYLSNTITLGMAETFIALLTDTWSQCCQCSSLLAVRKWMRWTVLQQNIEQKADWSLLQGRHLLQCRKILFLWLSSTVIFSSSPSLFSGSFSLWWTYIVKETQLITKKQTEEFRSGCEGEGRGRLCLSRH